MIQMTGIVKRYQNGVEALRGVDLRVEQGEFVAITGRSGSGKSTLMNIIGCLDTPSAGTYTLRGTDAGDASPRQRAVIRNRDIGFIFQSFNLAPRLTALENVELPLIFRGVGRLRRRELAEAALGRVGLYDRLRHYPSQLSGGQQQRVAIARAIASGPPLILADEPTGNLDGEAASACLGLLSELHRAGHTLILITHDPVAAAAAERRIVIEHGRNAI